MGATATRGISKGPFPGLSFGGKLQLEHAYTGQCNRNLKGGGKAPGLQLPFENLEGKIKHKGSLPARGETEELNWFS